MIITASLYPLLNTKSGITIIFDEPESEDGSENAKLHKKIIRQILQEHDNNTGLEREYEKYTLIISYNHKCLNEKDFPLIIKHSKPQRYRCSTVYSDLSKNDIWQRAVYDAKRMIDSDLDSDLENEVDYEPDKSTWEWDSDDSLPVIKKLI